MHDPKQSGRIAHVVNMLSGIKSTQAEGKLRVLDVAPHLLTTAIHRIFGNSIELSTLGYWDKKLTGTVDVKSHFEFDLNDTNFAEKWIKIGEYDVVIWGEIFEHLFACPKMTFGFMNTTLAKGGHLIIQTPNAAAIRNRLKFLFGSNPFDMIQPDRQGHVHEYTMSDLERLAQDSGLVVENKVFDDWLPERGPLRLIELIFPSLKRRLTIVLKK